MPIISFVRKCVFFSGAVMFGSEVLEVYANLILDWIFQFDLPICYLQKSSACAEGTVNVMNFLKQELLIKP